MPKLKKKWKTNIPNVEAEASAGVDFFEITILRGFQAVFGGAIVGIAAWLQSAFSADASLQQVAMRDSLYLAFWCSILGFLLALTGIAIRACGNLALQRYPMEQAAVSKLKETGVPYARLGPGAKKLHDYRSKRRTRVYRAVLRYRLAWKVFLMLAYITLGSTIFFVGLALDAAMNVDAADQQESVKMKNPW